MCDIGTAALVVSAVSAAGSAYSKQQQQEAQEKATRRAQDNYDQRLGELQDQASLTFGNTLDTYGQDMGQENLDTVATERTGEIQGNVQPVAEAGNVLRGSDNPVVKDAYEAALADAHAEGQDYAARVGRMGAFDQNRFLNDITLSRARQELGKLSNFAAGWGPVYQAEMEGARNAGSGWGTLGNVFTGLGTVSGAVGGLYNAGGSLGGLFGSGGSAADTGLKMVDFAGTSSALTPAGNAAIAGSQFGNMLIPTSGLGTFGSATTGLGGVIPSGWSGLVSPFSSSKYALTSPMRSATLKF